MSRAIDRIVTDLPKKSVGCAEFRCPAKKKCYRSGEKLTNRSLTPFYLVIGILVMHAVWGEISEREWCQISF